MNRPKFSQSMAGNSGYEGHAGVCSVPFCLAVRDNRQNQRGRMFRIVINHICRRPEWLIRVHIFAGLQITVAPGVQVAVKPGKLLLEISRRKMCPFLKTLLVAQTSMFNL